MVLPILQQLVAFAPLALGVPGVQAGAMHGAQGCAGLAVSKGAPPGPPDG